MRARPSRDGSSVTTISPNRIVHPPKRLVTGKFLPTLRLPVVTAPELDPAQAPARGERYLAPVEKFGLKVDAKREPAAAKRCREILPDPGQQPPAHLAAVGLIAAAAGSAPSC